MHNRQKYPVYISYSVYACYIYIYILNAMQLKIPLQLSAYNYI